MNAKRNLNGTFARTWSNEMLDILEEKYPYMSCHILELEKMGKTKRAISHMASRRNLKVSSILTKKIFKNREKRKRHRIICDFCGKSILRPTYKIEDNDTGYFFCSLRHRCLVWNKHPSFRKKTGEQLPRRNNKIWNRLRKMKK